MKFSKEADSLGKSGFHSVISGLAREVCRLLSRCGCRGHKPTQEVGGERGDWPQEDVRAKILHKEGTVSVLNLWKSTQIRTEK